MNGSAIRKEGSVLTVQLPIKRIAYLIAGHVLFGLGIVGILLPIMPTTVFWIGAAACYLKSSPEHYRALIARGRYGAVIVNFLDHGVIGSTEKRIAITGMIFSSIVILFLPVENIAKLFSILGISFAAIYVLTRPAEI